MIRQTQTIQCIADIRAWMMMHQLKLNNDKTNFIVLQSPHILRVYGIPNLKLYELILKSTDASTSAVGPPRVQQFSQ